MDPCTHLLFAPDASARIEMVTDLAIPMVATRGWTALTPATMAVEAGCTRQAVSQWFGDQQGLRLAVARRFTSRYARWGQIRVHGDGPGALLPETPELLQCSRVWLALTVASLHDPELTDLVEFGATEERMSITRALEREVWTRHQIGVSALAPVVAPLVAAVAGLRLSVALGPAEGLADRHDAAATTARAALDGAVRGLVGALA